VGNNIFECGQTYVALSRVKNLEGLYLSSFDVSKIKVNKKVQQFYEELNA
jgi:ATP-dependent DNA helicase PIF1